MRTTDHRRERIDQRRSLSDGPMRSFDAVGEILGCSGEQVRRETTMMQDRIIAALLADPVLRALARDAGMEGKPAGVEGQGGEG